MRLKKKKIIKKSLFPYFLLIFFTCSDKGEITVPNPFCLRKHHQLTVASAPTILQTPLGLQEGSAWALTQLNTQLPSGIRPYLLVYLLDSQTYTHVHMQGVRAFAPQGDWRGLLSTQAQRPGLPNPQQLQPPKSPSGRQMMPGMGLFQVVDVTD